MKWNRNPKNPLLSLRPGHFDSNHIHAPMVVRDGERYRMWYSGSDRIKNEFHRIGYAESRDGVGWERRSEPVLVPSEPAGYYTTPAVLRNADGSLRREDGLLVMWFCGHNRMCDLHLATSGDGIEWDLAVASRLNLAAYSPTVIFEEGLYKMWYTYVPEGAAMGIGHATSRDGITWEESPANPVLRSTEPREHENSLYPFVLKRGGLYEMYYTTYRSRQNPLCEIVVATSEDGVHWRKPGGPILSPDLKSNYDSLYCSRACVVTEPDGRDKLYYASRIDMNHKYFAIALAERQGR